MKPYNQRNIFPAGTVMNTTLNSTNVQVYGSFLFAIQVVFTGTPTGSFKLQESCDPWESGQPGYPTNWTDVASSTQNVTAAGNITWNYNGPGFNWVRVVYTDTSGGTSTATITSSTANIKGF